MTRLRPNNSHMYITTNIFALYTTIIRLIHQYPCICTHLRTKMITRSLPKLKVVDATILWYHVCNVQRYLYDNIV